MPNLDLPVLLLSGEIITNTYQLPPESAALPVGDVVLRTDQLDQLSVITGKKALHLTADDSPEQQAFPLDQLDCIMIEFASFNDGRGYSFATLLRRQGYQGELRAVGDVFKDVLNYLKRCGFDSFVIKAERDASIASAGLNDFTVPYQRSTAVAESSYQTGANTR